MGRTPSTFLFIFPKTEDWKTKAASEVKWQGAAEIQTNFKLNINLLHFIATKQLWGPLIFVFPNQIPQGKKDMMTILDVSRTLE